MGNALNWTEENLRRKSVRQRDKPTLERRSSNEYLKWNRAFNTWNA